VVGTRPEAERELRRLEGLEPATPVRVTTYTVAHALEDYLAGKGPEMKRSSVKSLRTSMVPLIRRLGSVPAEQLGLREVQRYRATRAKEGVKPGTANRELRAVRAALNEALLRGDVKEVPNRRVFKAVKPDEVPVTVLQPDQVSALLDVAGSRVRMALALAFFAGLRRSEIVHSDWGDWQDVMLHVRPKPTRGWSPKNHTCRAIPVSPRLRRELERFRTWTARSLPTDPIVQRSRIRVSRWDERALSKAATHAFADAGLNDPELRPGFHLGRRTAASRLSRHLPIRDLQRIMGWSSMVVAERYLAPSEELQVAAAAMAFPDEE
ncbi:MAG: tyrosine-type recombinase/integrase, partial [Planctomycetota bacterium]|jgi:integrase